MIDETIVAVFDTPDHAGAAVRELLAAKVPKGAIDQNPFAPGHDSIADSTPEGGPTAVSVTVKRAYVIQVIEILESHNPVDLDEPAFDEGPEPVGGGGILRLAEERLDIGKRPVNRGGARVHRYVVETPIERNVVLHDETVAIERRPVTDGRPVADGQFSDRTIEMTGVAQEAVVVKTAHVREEISLRKERVKRVQTVRETLRREDVAIERISGDSAASPES